MRSAIETPVKAKEAVDNTIGVHGITGDIADSAGV
jgi:hypothetical protein